jgi:GNAT superfamily N-acetyltransferase
MYRMNNKKILISHDNQDPLMISLQLLEENHLCIKNHEAIQKLLVSAFPQYKEIFSYASYWGARPSHRLWIEMQNGEIISHLDFEIRQINVGAESILIAGIGEVATHPKFHKRGLGRLLMSELNKALRTTTPVDFGYLQCRQAVLGFYTQVGWYIVNNKVQYIDPDTDKLTLGDSNSLILPACCSIDKWPTGLIDLQGMPW